MQQKENTLNLLLFFVLSALILAGSVFLQNWLNPPKPQSETGEQAAPQLWTDLQFTAPGTGLGLAAGSPGVGSAAQALVNAALVTPMTNTRARENLLALAGTPPPKPKPKPAAPIAQAKHEELVLGDDDWKLRAILTTRGAGVLSLTLPQFQAASAMGRPLPEKLELIPEEKNRENPSFVLYDYAKPDDRQPEETLGVRDWRLVSNKRNADGQEVVFETESPEQDLRIIKTYTLHPGDYHLGLKIELRRLGNRPEAIKYRYQLAGGHGLPIEGVWYTTIFRNALTGLLGQRNNFWRDFQDSRTISYKGGGDIVKGGEDKRIQYAGVSVQYFASVACVDEQQPNTDFVEWTRATVESEPDPHRPYLDDIQMRMISRELDLKPGQSVVHQYLLYHGPVKVRLLADTSSRLQGASPELVDRYINKLHLNTLTDYHFQGPGFPAWVSENIMSPIGWTYLIITMTNVMHTVLHWLYWLIPNYGVCIILLTFMVRGVMHPISRKQARTSMKMQALAPELKKLQEKHKNDRQQLAMEQMALYRRHGVSPVGSCWIVFLQMPIFMGLYYALQESIHFRLAPFLWIKNLAAPDMLIYWTQTIPWISRPEDQGSFLYLGPYFNLLPVVAVAFMIVQQKFLMPPAMDEQAEMQQKMMKYMMIFMGLMFYKVAAGLCIYFIVSSVWGLCERKLLPKTKPATADAAGAAPPPRGGSSGGSGGRGARNKPRGPKGVPNGQGNGRFQRVQEMWAELLKQAKKK
jgi:YidC/Oxa1 family membrane protein insertase